jgi:hypothetical protein
MLKASTAHHYNPPMGILNAPGPPPPLLGCLCGALTQWPLLTKASVCFGYP